MDKRPAIFVDRDDTLMVDVKYCDDPGLVRLIPRAIEGVRLLRNAGYLIVIVTNQSGVGRGYFSEETLRKVHDRLRSQLRQGGADFDAVYYCPHLPDDGCVCRKPSPGLIMRAALDLNIDLSLSYTIGDRIVDVQAGRAAGTTTVMIPNGSVDYYDPDDGPHFIARHLEEAAEAILYSAIDRGGKMVAQIRPHSSENQTRVFGSDNR